ncbi:hypothetical protein QN219_28735 [Sinorhizobium sp. 7-81]|nr:hypothetical protein [Sinorhizobium sp. 8-89]MDK1493973.1 hypothetical protein [Sinorhizobium sp. 8-89]
MSDSANDGILQHNREASAIWGAGGRHYDLVSLAISGALAPPPSD